MAEGAAPIPGILELDYLGDLTLYQHPPCMFILWWCGLGVNVLYGVVKDLIDDLMDEGERSSPPPPAPPAEEEEQEQEEEG